MPRARDVASRVGPPVSSPTFLAAEPGPRVPVRALTLTGVETPRAFDGFNQQPGDRSPRLDNSANVFEGRRHRGPASVFRPPRAVAPLREVNDLRPRPGLLPSCRSAMCSSLGLAACLGRTAWVLRIRFYNRRSLTCTRRKNTLSGGSSPGAVGKSRRRSAPRSSRTRRRRRRSRGRWTISRSSSLQRLRA